MNIIIKCSLILLMIGCTDDRKNNLHNEMPNSYNHTLDSSFFDRNLPEYQVHACLFDLLSSVAQSNLQFYDSNKFFYSLTFNKGKSYRYMNVSPELWQRAKTTDYSGVLKCGNMIFLCRGDFANDSLFFRKNSNQIRIKLQPTKDSIDLVPFNVEPTLEGAFYECKGLPIYLEVYVHEQISGFEKKVRKINH